MWKKAIVGTKLIFSSSESEPRGGRLRQESAWCFHYSKVMVVVLMMRTVIMIKIIFIWCQWILNSLGVTPEKCLYFKKKNKQTCVFVFVWQAVRWKIRSPVFVFMFVFVHVPVFGITYACICVTSRAMENKTSWVLSKNRAVYLPSSLGRSHPTCFYILTNTNLHFK